MTSLARPLIGAALAVLIAGCSGSPKMAVMGGQGGQGGEGGAGAGGGGAGGRAGSGGGGSAGVGGAGGKAGSGGGGMAGAAPDAAVTDGPAASQDGGVDTGVVGAGTPLATNGKLKVCGTNLCNQHDKPIQLRGISSHGLQWYPWGDCLNAGSMDSIAKDWGADVVRLSMYMQEGGWTTDKPRFTAMVDTLVDEVHKRGMYAIIDFHQLNPGNPMTNLGNAMEYFDHMASKHGPKGHVIYEICNEPNGSGVTWNVIRNYAAQVIPVIRKHDPTGIILVGTPDWSSLGVSGNGQNLWPVIAANKVTDANAMYVMHFYAGDHGAAYRDAVRMASAQLPLFVTEFGTQEASGDGPNDFGSSQLWLDLLAEKKISWVNWNFSDDPRTGAVLKNDTCPGGPWAGTALKPAGTWIFDRMKTPDNFPGP